MEITTATAHALDRYDGRTVCGLALVAPEAVILDFDEWKALQMDDELPEGRCDECAWAFT